MSVSADPPFISCTYNDTVVTSDSKEQTAVLECAVDNKEDGLNIVVNWTTADGRKIKEPHTVTVAVEEANTNHHVSYLLLHKISYMRGNVYSCNVFSEFGLEDQRNLRVIFSGKSQRCIC